MKRGFVFVMLSVFLISFVMAESCDLEAKLLNQDPYPAVPGDYVDLVFQITGLENPNCGDVSFELLEKYPISFDPNENPLVVVKSGTYTKDHSSVLMVPYTVRVDESALDGDNTIEVSFSDSYGSSSVRETKQFNLNVEDVKAEFEVYVKDYNFQTHELTFQILNTAKNDIYALSIEIPKQESVVVKGANRNIVGDLDSNDYTTTTFEAIPTDGKINLKLIYTDEINERRTILQSINFDSSYFNGRIADKKQFPIKTVLFLLVFISFLAWFFVKRNSKKNKVRR